MYNRSVICKVANNLRKQGYTLSAAFRAAWRLAKSKAAVKVAGVSKGNRQVAIDHLRSYAAECVQVTLQREPERIRRQRYSRIGKRERQQALQNGIYTRCGCCNPLRSYRHSNGDQSDTTGNNRRLLSRNV